MVSALGCNVYVASTDPKALVMSGRERLSKSELCCYDRTTWTALETIASL